MGKVIVDKDKCIGCGTCVALCPEAFELAEDGKAKVKESADAKKLEKGIKEAIDACPVQAISFTS